MSFKYNFPKIEQDGLTANAQVRKIEEEFFEVEAEQVKIYDASMSGEPTACDALVEETLDLIHACETLLRLLPVSKEQIDAARDMVEGKNSARGYYGNGVL